MLAIYDFKARHRLPSGIKQGELTGAGIGAAFDFHQTSQKARSSRQTKVKVSVMRLCVANRVILCIACSPMYSAQPIMCEAFAR